MPSTGARTTACTSLPTIMRASEEAVSLRGSAMADDLAVAHHGGGVAHALHLFEAMRDVEDRLALGAQPLQRLEQLVGFLRRQHRGRLVEDDEFRRLQQAADDLDALALADRKVADQRIGVERQAVAVGQRLRLGGDGGDRRPVVERERDVLRRRQRLEQRKVLEHHADAELLGNARAADLHRLAVPAYLAGIGFERAEQHFDQRGLAGAVLAEQRVDLALADRQVDRVARLERAEDLGQATNLEQVRAVTASTHSASHSVFQMCSCSSSRGHGRSSGTANAKYDPA